MRKRILIRGFVGVCLVCVLGTGVSAQQENFLAGYWPFEEGSGAEILDQSGNENHGTLTGDVQWVEGQQGQALEFARGACATIPDSDTLKDVEEFTVAMWVKLHTLPADWSHLFEKDGSYGITVNADKAFRFTYNSSAVWLESGFSIQPEKWYHIAMTWGPSGGAFYVDANNVAEEAGEITATDAAVNIAHCSSYLVDGVFDEVKIWNKELTSNEVKTAMQGAASVQPSSDKLPVLWGQLRLTATTTRP